MRFSAARNQPVASNGNAEWSNNTAYARIAPPLPAEAIRAQNQALARQRADCEKPVVVPAAVWRAGLTPPREKPVQTKVQFVIVHHSAGSNATTDFTAEVRNIYLLHMQVNGWNDAGYNFLIGRDGVIYEGRGRQGLMPCRPRCKPIRQPP